MPSPVKGLAHVVVRCACGAQRAPDVSGCRDKDAHSSVCSDMIHMNSPVRAARFMELSEPPVCSALAPAFRPKNSLCHACVVLCTGVHVQCVGACVRLRACACVCLVCAWCSAVVLHSALIPTPGPCSTRPGGLRTRRPSTPLRGSASEASGQRPRYSSLTPRDSRQPRRQVSRLPGVSSEALQRRGTKRCATYQCSDARASLACVSCSRAMLMYAAGETGHEGANGTHTGRL